MKKAAAKPVKVSPDNFLSQHRIDYSGSHFQGSPAQIVAAFVALNGTRSWDTEIDAFTYNVYSTPGYIAGPSSPAAQANSNVVAERKAVEAVHLMEKTGNHKAIYHAVDAVNAVRMAMGGIIGYQPPSDFDIYEYQVGSVGDMARTIAADRVSLATAPESLSDHQLMEYGLFDSKAFYDALNAYAAS